MLRSECCGATVYDDYDLCSECLDHCDVWEDVDEDEDEPYDHSIDTIDPDEPPIPGPPYDSYGYNDEDEDDFLDKYCEEHPDFNDAMNGLYK